MRNYELMVILDPNLDERTVTPSLETFLRVVTGDGGKVEKVDVWGKRRMSFEIAKHAEGIYAVLNVTCEPATVSELDRQLGLNESVLRTKVMRVEAPKRRAAQAAAAPARTGSNPGAGPAAVAAASTAAPAASAAAPAASAAAPAASAAAPAAAPAEAPAEVSGDSAEAGA